MGSAGIVKIGLSLVLLGLAAFGGRLNGAAAAFAAPPALNREADNRMPIDSISVFASTGKPSVVFDPAQPHEQITARRDGDRYILIVGVNVPRDNVSAYREETATISADEWNAIVDVVARYDLLNFSAHKPRPPIYDYGTYGFSIVGEQSNRQTWDAPLENSEGPLALARLMGQMTQEKVTAMRLYHLVP